MMMKERGPILQPVNSGDDDGKTIRPLGVPVQAREIRGASGVVVEASVRSKYRRLTLRLIAEKTAITTMESCTGGQIASLITDTEGASEIIRGAFVTYANEAKIRQGVPAEIIDSYGVYSAETAVAMARACREAYDADIGVGVTGSFGNADPNNPDSVPGEVYFGIATIDGAKAYHCRVPVQPSRLAYKLYMADVIADRLLAADR